MLLLLIERLAGFLFLAVLLLGLGEAVWASAPRVRDRFQGAMLPFMTLSLGAGIFTGIVSWLGLLGLLTVWLVWPPLLIIAVCGLIRIVSRQQPQARDLIGLPSTGIGFLAVAALALWGLHLFLGALPPDMSHDTMWYHLSLPQEWAAAGRLSMPPTVMPALYALGQEAVYASFFVIGRPEWNTLYYALISLLLFGGIIAVGYEFGEKTGVALSVAAFIPLLAGSIAKAPIYAHNDNAAALFLLATFAIFFCGQHLSSDKTPDIPIADFRLFMIAGIFGGAAVATKLLALAFLGPIVLLASIYYLFIYQNNKRVPLFLKLSMGLLLGGLISYLPWAIRGLLNSGNPVYPFARSLFPTHEPWQAAEAASAALNSLYPVSIEGMTSAITEGIPAKVSFAIAARDSLFFIIPVTALLALVFAIRNRDKKGALISLLPLLCYLALLPMKGFNEVQRYFAISYPLGVAAIAYTVHSMITLFPEPPGSREGKIFIIGLAIGCYTDYASEQMRWAKYPTIGYTGYPILLEEDVIEYAARQEKGGYWLLMRDVGRHLRPSDHVLVLDSSYAHPLPCRATWADEVNGDMPARLPLENATEMRDHIIEEEITHLLQIDTDDPLPTWLLSLEKAGAVGPPFEGTDLLGHTWRLWPTAQEPDPRNE